MKQTLDEIIIKLQQDIDQVVDESVKITARSALNNHQRKDVNEQVTIDSFEPVLQTASLLHIAALVNSPGAIEDLITQHQAAPNLSNGKKTPLHIACFRGHYEAADMLVKHKASIEAADKSALHEAIRGGHLNIVQLLLDDGADPNTSKQGNPALHLAIQEDRFDIVEQLLKVGANVNAANTDNQSPIQSALLQESPNADIVFKLIDYGAVTYGLLPRLTLKVAGLREIANKNNAIINASLVREMQKMGYNIDSQGVCFGLSEVAKQAHLIDSANTSGISQIQGMAAFEARLQLLAKIESIELLLYLLDGVKKQEKHISDLSITQKAIWALDKEYSQNGRTLPLPLKVDELRADLMAFFDSIYLYQSPYNKNELFDAATHLGQSQAPAKYLVTPSVLEKDPPQEIASFPGAYNLKSDRLTMQKYLQGLHGLFGWHSFTLDISNAGHRIQLNYDHHHNQWCLIDANQLPPKYFGDLHNQHADSDQISRFNALFTQAIGNPKTRLCTLNTKVFINRSHALNLANTQFNPHDNNDDEPLQTLHQFYSKQIKAWSIHQLNEHNTIADTQKLMIFACEHGYIDTLEQLLNQKGLSKDIPGSHSFFATTGNSITFGFYNTLIQYAMGNSNMSVTQWLLQWAKTKFSTRQDNIEPVSAETIQDYFAKLNRSSLGAIIQYNLSDTFIETLKQHYSNLNDIYQAHNNRNLFENKFEDYIQQRCAVHLAAKLGNQHKLRVLILNSSLLNN